MNRVVVLLALVACAPPIDPGPIPARQAEAPVRLIEQPDPAVPNLYLQATIAAGSARDPNGRAGLAHLVARSLVEGGAGDRTPEAVRRDLAVTGNDFELIVDREWVTLRLKCHVDQQESCLRMFTDALLRPRFDPAVIRRLVDEAGYAVDEGLRADDERLGLATLEGLLYEGHPYAHPPEGRGGVLPLLDASLAARFFDAHYVRESMVVGLAGGYSPDTADTLREALRGVPKRRAPELVLASPPPPRGRTLTVVDTGAGDTVGLHLGHPLSITRDHPDWPALYLAATALGAHRQSFGRLFREVRAERGLSYGAYAYVEPYRERGGSSSPEQGVLRRQPAFVAWVRPVRADQAPFALKLAVDELERFVADGPTEDEFQDIRSFLTNATPLLARDPGRRLAYAVEAEASGVPNLLTTLPDALAALTRDEVHLAVQRHIRPDDLRIVAVTGAPDALVAPLLEGQATPVVYDGELAPDADTVARDAEVARRDLDLDPSRVWTLDAQGIFR